MTVEAGKKQNKWETQRTEGEGGAAHDEEGKSGFVPEAGPASVSPRLIDSLSLFSLSLSILHTSHPSLPRLPSLFLLG